MSTDEITDQTSKRRLPRLRYLVPAALVTVVLIAAAVLCAVVASAKPRIALSAKGLATLSTPFGTGSVARVSAVGGLEQKDIPVALRGADVWPTRKVEPGERIRVVATVRRPGWISWLTGSTERVTLTEVAPVAKLTSTFLTRAAGHPLKVKFRQPVSVAGSYAVGAPADPHRLAMSQTSITVHTTAPAGTITVAAAVRSWERPTSTTVSWFPRGKRASAVATPAPGSRITSSTPIILTFSRPVKQVLGERRPPVNRTIEFRPTGDGYGLGATVSVLLPSTVYLLGASQSSPTVSNAGGAQTTTGATGTTGATATTTGAATAPAKTASGANTVVGSWTVPEPSTEALQELLAELGYLPVKFKPDVGPASGPVATATGASAAAGLPLGSTVAELETAATDPPKGRFRWRYPHTPALLKRLWSAKNWTELTKGAVMAFESNQGLTTDGIASPTLWKALITAAAKRERAKFGYTFVMVSESLPQNIRVWHNGKIVVHGPVNTGISVAPTATGTYAVYEHLAVTTMSGLNPNGTPYHDPGIPWVSYFNGGDALHGFIRASYGFPQSLGCVEMPFSEAGQVWPYTPVGTIVNVGGSA
jgi:peptidoglycan hydrolase-like protein with peptidoglycan-binding domain